MGASRDRQRCRALLFGNLQAALDFADVLQIVAQPGAIARAEVVLETRNLARDLVENAAIFLNARLALFRRAAIAEKPLEDHARIDLHRQRRGGRAPGDRIHVAAAIAGVACADHAGHVFGGEFERRIARALADVLRGNLIDRDAGPDVFAFGAPGMNAAEEGRAGAGVIGASVTQRIGLVMG